ncbi:hypothetical protein M0811_04734 [Anaeramoeba ignava]|uniref:Uncharacterized protein n=1 Tax=Anaeramoeba ignava TaxID=1746090 RepID=A0A9Q0LSF4_ANAIG|nr:hypothetical protein M0811_04734 [Anaeramoeba ignava]
MVNDNFKLILTTNKEEENFGNKFLNQSKFNLIVKFRNINLIIPKFPFFHYFYEVITEDYHQENKDILKDIVDEPIENWSKIF